MWTVVVKAVLVSWLGVCAYAAVWLIRRERRDLVAAHDLRLPGPRRRVGPRRRIDASGMPLLQPRDDWRVLDGHAGACRGVPTEDDDAQFI